MKTALASALTLIALLSCDAFGQGSLTPPPGPPVPTMKSLDQVEARTAIDPTQPGFALPYTISQPGSYYLTRNVTASASAAGIIIAADDVTVDLNGFSLNGAGVGTRGIDVPAARKNLTVRNGTVRGWTQGGVRADLATNCILEKLRASANTGGSLVGALVAGNGSLITECVATSNTSSTNGIKTFSGTTIVNCSASSNGGSGIFVGGTSTISNCTTNGNGIYGIRAFSTSTLTRCNAGSNASVGISTGDGCTVIECTAAINTGSGIETANGSTLRNCTAYTNSASGILAGIGCTLSGSTVYANTLDGITTGSGCSVRDCTATSNLASGITTAEGCTIANCTPSANAVIGIYAGAGSTVRECTVRANSRGGIRARGNCQVLGNTCDSNGGSTGANDIAIEVDFNSNRIDSNHCSNNSTIQIGIFGSSNFIARNTFHGSGTHVVEYAGPNTVGPIINMTAGGTITTTNPWANFSN